MPDHLLVDTDTHMIEPRDLFAERRDKQYRDRAPRIVTDPPGLEGDHWVMDEVRPVNAVSGSSLGETRDPQEYDEFVAKTRIGNVRPGGLGPAERLKDMAIDGIGAGIAFPTNCAFMYGLRDLAFQDALFRSYNDWLAEFPSHDPKRLAGTAMIQVEDTELGAREVQRAAKSV